MPRVAASHARSPYPRTVSLKRFQAKSGRDEFVAGKAGFGSPATQWDGVQGTAVLSGVTGFGDGRVSEVRMLRGQKTRNRPGKENALGSGKGVRAGERTACARGAGDGVAAGARSRFALSLPELPQPESRAASTVKVSS